MRGALFPDRWLVGRSQLAGLGLAGHDSVADAVAVRHLGGVAGLHALALVALQVAFLVFLPAAAPAEIVAAEDDLGVLRARAGGEQIANPGSQRHVVSIPEQG